MTESRRHRLEAMLEGDPGDQLLRYMLAMESEKEGNSDHSLQLLSELMRDDPPYVPAFLMAGQQQARLGRPEEARASYTDGIRSARRQGDAHAAQEMAQFLQELD